MAEEAKKIHINPSDVRLSEEGISYLWNHIKEFVKKRVPDAEETDATKFLRGDSTWGTIETDGTITGDGSASAKFSVQESLDDLYETIKAELSARAVFGYATKEALPVPGDPSKVYYVGPSENVDDAYDVYVWSTQGGTGEYVLVDESSISLEGYWHGEPTEEGDGNVVTGLVAEADGTVTVQKGITAVEKGSIVAGTDLVVEETEDGKTLVRVNTTGEATGEYAFAEGGGTTASGAFSHAEGAATTASGPNSHAEGGGTTASGENSHAEGAGTKAIGVSSHAEGSGTTASGDRSHAEGAGTKAIGDSSHAEGAGTNASGVQSHAEGGGTTALGENSHAEGLLTTAVGRYSHAEGFFSVTTGSMSSHAEGGSNKSIRSIEVSVDDADTFFVPNDQTVELHAGYCVFNSLNTGNSYAIITDVLYTPSSGLTRITLDRKITSTKLYYGFAAVASGEASHAEGTASAHADYSHAEGDRTVASGLSAHAEGGETKAIGAKSHAEGGGTTASGSVSHAEGGGSMAIGESSHAEGGGTTAFGAQSHAEGGGSIASGGGSHAEGAGTTAGGQNSHSEGVSSNASGFVSHAEGGFTVSSNNYTHAEGHHTTASGEVSHAEGEYTVANAPRSHAEGNYTIAAGADQHVQGRFNVEDDTKAHIVGGGTSSVGRKNIHTLDWAGNAFFAGDITFNGNTSLTEALQHSGGGGGDIVAGEGLKKEGDTISVAYGAGLKILPGGSTTYGEFIAYYLVWYGLDYDDANNIGDEQISFADGAESVITISNASNGYINPDTNMVAIHINTDMFGDITVPLDFASGSYTIRSYPSNDGRFYLNLSQSTRYPGDFIEAVICTSPDVGIDGLTDENSFHGTIKLIEPITTAEVITYYEHEADTLAVNVDNVTIGVSNNKLSAVEMVGATMQGPGKGGIVPSPDWNDQILTGNGKWSFIGAGLQLLDYSSGTGNVWIKPEFTSTQSVTLGADGETLFNDIDLETPSSYSQVIGFSFTMPVESLPHSNILNVGMISSETGMLQATVTVNGGPAPLYGASMPSSPPYMYALIGTERDFAYMSFKFLDTPIDESPYSFMPIDITFTNNCPIAISGTGTGTSTLCAVEMSGAGSSSDGLPGMVPAPLHGDQDKFLRGDGTWATPAGGGGGSTVSTSYDDTTETVTIRIG